MVDVGYSGSGSDEWWVTRGNAYRGATSLKTFEVVKTSSNSKGFVINGCIFFDGQDSSVCFYYDIINHNADLQKFVMLGAKIDVARSYVG